MGGAGAGLTNSGAAGGEGLLGKTSLLGLLAAFIGGACYQAGRVLFFWVMNKRQRFHPSLMELQELQALKRETGL